LIAAIALASACSSHHPTSPSGQQPAPGSPSITTQPAGEGLNQGQGASLWVVASGNGPLTYQWYLGQSGDGSTPIAGATESTYNTPNLLLSSAFWVRVSNSAGSANSTTAVIEVRNAVALTGDPFEDQLIVLINQQRAVGVSCGGTAFPAVAGLATDASLQTAARLHSLDMALNHFFSHTSLDGRTFTQRIRNAGFTGSPLAENIARDYSTPQMTFDSWMASSVDCTNLMSSAYQAIGIGYTPGSGSGPYWTADFGGH
jgi:uncharacterized protein YkwD